MSARMKQNDKEERRSRTRATKGCGCIGDGQSKLRKLQEETERKQEEYQKVIMATEAAHATEQEKRKRAPEKIRAKRRAAGIRIVEFIPYKTTALSSIVTAGNSSKLEVEKNRIHERLKARRLAAQIARKIYCLLSRGLCPNLGLCQLTERSWKISKAFLLFSSEQLPK